MLRFSSKKLIRKLKLECCTSLPRQRLSVLCCSSTYLNCLITRELGIGIVSFNPVAYGFCAGKAIVESLSPDSFLHKYPRITGEIFEKNKNTYTRLESLARKHRCTAVQLALSWVLHQGICEIKNLNEHIGSLKVKLTTDDLKEISDALPPDGDVFSFSCRFKNTRPPSTMTK